MPLGMVLHSLGSADPGTLLQLIGFFIMLTMTICSIVVIAKWPSQVRGRAVGGALLVVLPWTGVIIGFLVVQLNLSPPLELVFFIPFAWVVWIGLYIFARVEIRRERKRSESMPAVVPTGRGSQVRPYSAGPAVFAGPAATAPPTEESADDEPAVVARCVACMGRWKTTASAAKTLQACPKCGVSPPDLRLQRIK